MPVSIKNPNQKVSSALLKALGNGTSGKPTISNTEWNEIKKAALYEVRHSDNPAATLREIKSSFSLADNVTAGKFKEKFGELVQTTLADAVETRKNNLRQVDTNDWGGSSRRRTYNPS